MARRKVSESDGRFPEGFPAGLVDLRASEWCSLDDPKVDSLMDDGKTPRMMALWIVARGRFVAARWEWCNANSDDPNATFRTLPPIGAPRWRK